MIMSEHFPITYAKLAEARDLHGYGIHTLGDRFAAVRKASIGSPVPLTFRQVEQIARLTGYPLGFFFMAASPDMDLPIPDLRAKDGGPRLKISRPLHEQVLLSVAQSDWYRGFAVSGEFEKVLCVGSKAGGSNPEAAACEYACRVGVRPLMDEMRRGRKSASAFMRALRERIEDLGILTEASGICGNDPKAVFSFEEFSGFAIADAYAPLIFVNGNAAPEAQVFTLMQEFAHILRGEPGISGFEADAGTWCARFAMESLLPKADLAKDLTCMEDVSRLARSHFVTSELALLGARRRGAIGDGLFDELRKEAAAHQAAVKRRSGGSLVNSMIGRTSRRFACALICSVKSGATLFTDGLQLLDLTSSPL